jgi:hypothetical protein
MVRPPLKLYRQILRLHRRLPPAMRALGDDYAKSEFRRHRAAEAQYLPAFFAEWTRYADVLRAQTATDTVVGEKIELTRLEKFNNEQIGQLFALKTEIKSK